MAVCPSFQNGDAVAVIDRRSLQRCDVRRVHGGIILDIGQSRLGVGHATAKARDLRRMGINLRRITIDLRRVVVHGCLNGIDVVRVGRGLRGQRRDVAFGCCDAALQIRDVCRVRIDLALQRATAPTVPNLLSSERETELLALCALSCFQRSSLKK